MSKAEVVGVETGIRSASYESLTRPWEYSKSLPSSCFPEALIETDEVMACRLATAPYQRSGELKGIGCAKRMQQKRSPGLFTDGTTGFDFRPFHR